MVERRMMKIEEAVLIIEEDIGVHRQWKDYFESHPRMADELVARVKSVGDVDHHQLWIDRLTLVLEVLQREKVFMQAAIADRLYLSLVELIETDPHDLNDTRPCGTCRAAKSAIALYRAEAQ